METGLMEGKLPIKLEAEKVGNWCLCVATQYFVLEKVKIWEGMGSYEFYGIGRRSIKLLLDL